MNLSSLHEIMVLLALKGGPEYDAQMKAAAASTGDLGKALLATSANMDVATRRTWLHNQALFTARRYAFYATLAITGLVYEVAKLGFSYNNTVQTAKVALKGMFPTTKAMDAVIGKLYKMSTLSPFLFKDTLTAFRTMAPAMKNAGIPVQMTLATMHATMDALSESGHATVGNLSRVSIQLQHMANIGRPTGQVLLALARDGLPVYPALRKELHLTGNALEQVAGSGLTAKQVIQALNKFIETSPIYKGQAFKQATSTLTGNWRMFRDILAQASGRATGGLFTGLQDRLVEINKSLLPMFNNNKPIGMYNIAQAINNSLTPNTNIIINLFNVLTTAIATAALEFQIFFGILRGFFWIPEKLAGLFGANILVSRAWGAIIGTLITVFILAKAVLMPFIIAIELWNAAVRVARAVAIAYRVIMLLTQGEWATATALIWGNNAATEANAVATVEDTAAKYAAIDAFIAQRLGLASLTMATEVYTVELDTASVATYAFAATAEAATPAVVGFGLAVESMLGPIGLAITALSLLIIYHKQIARWTGTRSLNPFSHTFWHQSRSRPPTRAEMTAANAPRSHSWADIFNPMSWFQHGGTMSRSGLAMVGEAGPELLHLPGGASVHPLGGSGAGGMFNIKVFPQDIYLDSKKIATVLATAVTDKEARA